MTYYKDLQRAYSWITKKSEAAKENEVRLDGHGLAYEATKKFPVGEKKLKQRMQQMIEYDNAPIDL